MGVILPDDRVGLKIGAAWAEKAAEEDLARHWHVYKTASAVGATFAVSIRNGFLLMKQRV